MTDLLHLHKSQINEILESEKESRFEVSRSERTERDDIRAYRARSVRALYTTVKRGSFSRSDEQIIFDNYDHICLFDSDDYHKVFCEKLYEGTICDYHGGMPARSALSKSSAASKHSSPLLQASCAVLPVSYNLDGFEPDPSSSSDSSENSYGRLYQLYDYLQQRSVVRFDEVAQVCCFPANDLEITLNRAAWHKILENSAVNVAISVALRSKYGIDTTDPESWISFSEELTWLDSLLRELSIAKLAVRDDEDMERVTLETVEHSERILIQKYPSWNPTVSSEELKTERKF